MSTDAPSAASIARMTSPGDVRQYGAGAHQARADHHYTAEGQRPSSGGRKTGDAGQARRSARPPHRHRPPARRRSRQETDRRNRAPLQGPQRRLYAHHEGGISPRRQRRDGGDRIRRSRRSEAKGEEAAAAEKAAADKRRLPSPHGPKGEGRGEGTLARTEALRSVSPCSASPIEPCYGRFGGLECPKSPETSFSLFCATFAGELGRAPFRNTPRNSPMCAPRCVLNSPMCATKCAPSRRRRIRHDRPGNTTQRPDHRPPSRRHGIPLLGDRPRHSQVELDERLRRFEQRLDRELALKNRPPGPGARAEGVDPAPLGRSRADSTPGASRRARRPQRSIASARGSTASLSA